MSLFAAVSDAVRASLNRANKPYDLDAALNKIPYDYSDAGRMRVLLIDISAQLRADIPSWALDVDTLNIETLVGDTVSELQADLVKVLSAGRATRKRR